MAHQMAYVSLMQKKKILTIGQARWLSGLKKIWVPSSETVWTKEKPDSWKLFSDLHTFFVAHLKIHMYIYTNN